MGGQAPQRDAGVPGRQEPRGNYPDPGSNRFVFSPTFRKSEETVLNQVLEMTTEGDVIDEKTRETMAALNSQVRSV